MSVSRKKMVQPIDEKNNFENKKKDELIQNVAPSKNDKVKGIEDVIQRSGRPKRTQIKINPTNTRQRFKVGPFKESEVRTKKKLNSDENVKEKSMTSSILPVQGKGSPKKVNSKEKTLKTSASSSATRGIGDGPIKEHKRDRHKNVTSIENIEKKITKSSTPQGHRDGSFRERKRKEVDKAIITSQNYIIKTKEISQGRLKKTNVKKIPDVKKNELQSKIGSTNKSDSDEEITENENNDDINMPKKDTSEVNVLASPKNKRTKSKMVDVDMDDSDEMDEIMNSLKDDTGYTKSSNDKENIPQDRTESIEMESDEDDAESDGDIFECGVCNEEFNSKENLLAHIETHEGVQFMLLHEVDEDEEHQVHLKYECTHCPLPFETAEDLDYHIKDHFNKENKNKVNNEKDEGRRKDFVCNICGKKYEKNFALQHHIQVVHFDNKRFACNVCDKRFALSGTLKKHMYIHGNIRPYKCKECRYSCNQRGTLVRHVQRKHLKEKRYGCEICGKLFVTKYEVFQHHNKGHNEDLLQCTLCEYKCKEVDTLKNHLRIHNETPYKCNLCSRKFSDYEFYQDHVRTHKGQKAYKCSFCSYACNHNTAFAYHMKRIHPNEMPFPCRRCDKKFDNSAKLKRHMLYHTADQIYMCEKCEFITVTWSQLKEHYFGKEIDKIINKCRICGEKFRSLEDVQEHMSDHCIRKRLRNVPTETIKIKREWYKCYYCYKKFRSKMSLSIHVKSHDESDRKRIKYEFPEEEEDEEEEYMHREVITADASIQFDGEEFDHVKKEKNMIYNDEENRFDQISDFIIETSNENGDESWSNQMTDNQTSLVSTSRIISTEELMSMESPSQNIVFFDENDSRNSENATGTIRELLDDWE